MGFIAKKGEVKLESTDLAHIIVDIMDDRQAVDIALLDIRTISIISDYFVIGTGESQRQIQALKDVVIETVKMEHALKPLASEGSAESGWILLDFGDVVAHIFAEEERAYYQLEQLWEEATLVVRIP